MSATLSITETQVFTALRSVMGTFGLASSTGGAVPIIRGQVNRVAEPASPDFVILWPTTRNPLTQTFDTYADNQVTGSITANILTVTRIIQGAPAAGQALFATGITAGCQIVQQLTGATGGAGTYSTTTTANVGSSTIYCGTVSANQETEITIQADIHGLSSADNYQRITTLFKNQFAITAFQALGLPLSPLYPTGHGQVAFTNAEQQWEERWVVDLCMQGNISVTTPMQFADQLEASLVVANYFMPVLGQLQDSSGNLLFDSAGNPMFGSQ